MKQFYQWTPNLNTEDITGQSYIFHLRFKSCNFSKLFKRNRYKKVEEITATSIAKWIYSSKKIALQISKNIAYLHV